MENRIKGTPSVTIYTLLMAGHQERELTREEVQEILAHAETEHRGHAVYDVEETITIESEGTDWDRKLWAYRIGDTWTTVPAAFESMTIHWKE